MRSRFYRPELHGLRFVAFLLVFVQLETPFLALKARRFTRVQSRDSL